MLLKSIQENILEGKKKNLELKKNELDSLLIFHKSHNIYSEAYSDHYIQKLSLDIILIDEQINHIIYLLVNLPY